MDLKLINKIEIFEFIYRVDQGKILNKSSDFGKFSVFFIKNVKLKSSDSDIFVKATAKIINWSFLR